MKSKAIILTTLTATILFCTKVSAQKGGRASDAVNFLTTQYRATSVSFNSASSDFGLFPYSENNLFFSSNRENENSENANKAYNWNNLPFLDLYIIMKSGDTTFSAPIALPGNREAKFNEGPIFYDPVNSTFFITRNDYNKKKNQQSRHGVNRLKIYIENIDGTTFKSFGEFQHNNNNYSVGHAALSNDGTRIYFASDMPGGQGGTDLYVCTRDGEKWSAPQNLGAPVNTTGNEMFPFYSTDNKLYFSSNGQAQQVGLDIYSVDVAGNEYKNLRNIGLPFNSQNDDFSFYIYPDNRTGYFSSNRPGGKGDDDIYFFEPNNPVIKGVVYDDKGANWIPFAKIKIMDDALKITEISTDSAGTFSFEAKWADEYTLSARKEGHESSTKSVTTSRDKSKFEVTFNLIKEQYGVEGLVLNKDSKAPVAGASVSLINNATKQINNAVTDDKGAFRFSVAKNSDYTVKAEKTKFMTSSVPVSTQGMAIGTKKQNILLEELVVGKSIKIENVYYDLGKWDIRADAKIELDKMVALMNENPSMEVELSAHTDSRGSDASNLSLSDKRAKSVAAYIVSKGISSARIFGKGYGETKLLNSCNNTKKCSDAEHQVNRRTEFKILKIQ